MALPIESSGKWTSTTSFHLGKTRSIKLDRRNPPLEFSPSTAIDAFVWRINIYSYLPPSYCALIKSSPTDRPEHQRPSCPPALAHRLVLLGALRRTARRDRGGITCSAGCAARWESAVRGNAPGRPVYGPSARKCTSAGWGGILIIQPSRWGPQPWLAGWKARLIPPLEICFSRSTPEPVWAAKWGALVSCSAFMGVRLGFSIMLKLFIRIVESLGKKMFF